MFYWILTSSLLALKSRACIYIRMDACITNTGWCNGGSVLMSEKMQKLDENWFSFFFKQIFIQIYRWSSVFSVKHGDLDAAIPPPSLSSVSRCSPETRGGSRRSDTCALRAQAVISSARAAHRLRVSREECCPFSPPHRCKTEAARDALRGRFLLVSIPLQFVRKAPQVSAFTLNNNPPNTTAVAIGTVLHLL